MEKLTIEKKAKRYDNSLEMARKWYNANTNEGFRGIFEDIFPELKENNDEKIRKALIRFHKSTIDVDGIKGEDIIAWLEKQGEQKSVNTVKTKFKVGDWLVHNERKNIIKVVNATPLIYKVVDVLGYHHTITDTAIENNYHLWTIKDAKDGDVLACGNDIVIFKENSYNPKDQSGCMFVYCSCNNFYEIGGINPTTYKPATEEQRNILFAKMKEAGYTFDFEKKELKRIVQKSARSEEFETRLTNIIIMLKEVASHHFIKDDITKAVDFLKSLMSQNTITDEELAQAKKDAYNDVLDKIEYDSENPTFDDGWSAAIWYLKKRNLLPQNVWKPSDEQIKALSYYLKNDVDNEGVFGRQLVKLYQDLLKLREE